MSICRSSACRARQKPSSSCCIRHRGCLGSWCEKKVPTACACPTGVSVPCVPRSACIQRSRGRPAGTRAVGYHGTARGTRCPSAHARACSQIFSGTRPGPHEVGRTGSAGATYDAPHRVADTVRREIHVGLLRRSPDHVRKTAATVDDVRSTSP